MKTEYDYKGKIRDLIFYADELNELVIRYNSLDNGDYRNDQDNIDQFDEFIDSLHHEGCKVFSYSYCASRVLKELDPIAYDQAFDEYFENQERDGLNDDLESKYYDIQSIIADLQSSLYGTKPPLWEALQHINKDVNFWRSYDCLRIQVELTAYIKYLKHKYSVSIDQ